MAFIDIDYLIGLGFRVPQSSVSQVTTMLNNIIERRELEYFQNTIGYTLTTDLYALVEPYPAEVEIFLNGNLVDGDDFYKGILVEVGNYIMCNYYPELAYNVNNSGFGAPIADGEDLHSTAFEADRLLNTTLGLRKYTERWLEDNQTGFFESWQCEYFQHLDNSSVW